MALAPALISSFVAFAFAFWRYRNWRKRNLHARFYDSTSARLMKTLLTITAISLIIAVVSQVLHITVPTRPAYSEDYLFFPLLIIARSTTFWFLPSIIIVISSLSFFILTLYFETKTSRVLSSVALMCLVMPLTLAACFIQVFVLWMPVIEHRTMIEFDNQIFRIVYSEGPTGEFDFTEARYIIYECDNVGLICRNVGAQVREVSPNHLLLRDAQTFFVVENQRLYAIIGDNRITVR